MIGGPTLTKSFVVLAAIGLGIGVRLGAEPSATPPFRGTAISIDSVGATFEPEAQRMRTVTLHLAGEVHATRGCPHRRRAFAACVAPALRHVGIGGRMAATVLRGIARTGPSGSCRGYLFGLEVANDAAADQARWLLPRLYEPGGVREIASQLALAAGMLHRAARAASPGVCSVAADGPPG
jgi:hypothetical protein